VSRLRRREVIPEDTSITALLTAPKLVFGRFGRQLETTVRVVEGEYKGTEFKNWFSFGRDKDTEEEYISYGGTLHRVLAMAEPRIDEILDADEDISEREYERFLKETTKKLDGLKVLARVGVRAPEGSPEKKRNYLMPGTIGPYEDPEEGFEQLKVEDALAEDGEEAPAPF
jgi:hypothetical protein